LLSSQIIVLFLQLSKSRVQLSYQFEIIKPSNHGALQAPISCQIAFLDKECWNLYSRVIDSATSNGNSATTGWIDNL